MKRFLQLIGVFGVNAVPAAGFFGGGWSIATTLAVYWIENLLSSLLTIVRIAIHRRTTRKRGHLRAAMQLEITSKGKRVKMKNVTFLKGFAMSALPFALAHGVFIAVLVGMVLPSKAGGEVKIDREELAMATIATTAFLLVGFCVDLVGIRQRPFAWIRKLAEYSMGRMMVIHMTIILGMFGMIMMNATRSIFVVFVVLKTLLEITMRVPQYKPKEPPRFLASILDRFGKQNGESFSEYWRRTHKEEVKTENDDELVG